MRGEGKFLLCILGLLYLYHVSSFLHFSPLTSNIPTNKDSLRFIPSNIANNKYITSLPKLSSLRMCSTSSSSSEKSYYHDMTPYEIFDVSSTATIDEIRSAYNILVTRWQPENFKNDPKMKKEGQERLMKIHRAWFILSDEDRRRRYDIYGEAGVGATKEEDEEIRKNGGPTFGFNVGGKKSKQTKNPFDFSSAGSEEEDGEIDVNSNGLEIDGISGIKDLFDMFFGGGSDDIIQTVNPFAKKTSKKGGNNGRKDGQDIHITVEIPFMTAIKGGTENIMIKCSNECSVCHGSGLKPGTKPKTCATCGGEGHITQVERTPFGMVRRTAPCHACGGTGIEKVEHCPACKGKGTQLEAKEIAVTIPPGISATDAKLRVKGVGNAGINGGKPGDVYVNVNVKKDDKFQRDGLDIYSEEEISYLDAILGATITVDTIDGPTEIKIAPGTQPQQKLRLRGKGVPRMDEKGRGDAYVTVKTKLPAKPTSQELALLQQLAAVSSVTSRNVSTFPKTF